MLAAGHRRSCWNAFLAALTSTIRRFIQTWPAGPGGRGDMAICLIVALQRRLEADASRPAGDGRLPHAQRALGHERAPRGTGGSARTLRSSRRAWAFISPAWRDLVRPRRRPTAATAGETYVAAALVMLAGVAPGWRTMPWLSAEIMRKLPTELSRSWAILIAVLATDSLSLAVAPGDQSRPFGSGPGPRGGPPLDHGGLIFLDATACFAGAGRNLCDGPIAVLVLPSIAVSRWVQLVWNNFIFIIGICFEFRHSHSVPASMLLGYNTNGLAHHDLFDAVELLADIGYRSVAITIDHTALPPNGASHLFARARTRSAAASFWSGARNCGSVIETGCPISLWTPKAAKA